MTTLVVSVLLHKAIIEKMAPNSNRSKCKNDAIVIREVHDVATDTSTETRKPGRQARCSCELGDSASCESKPALFQESVASQSGVDEHPEVYAANTYGRLPQK
ncbi:hypothetical protein Fmac_028562 [Flemingia macrophylla]|uniref:Uncharacterized protein n=1 Tax=Flemingia macrophylla TaxID=520843 RepID=A0ABD1L8A1_9FABA